MSPDVRWGEALRKHEHLQVVDELRDFFCSLGVGLVLGSHPDFGGLLDDLLADLVHAGIQFGDGAAALGARHGLLADLSEEFVESLHGLRVAGRAGAPRHGRPIVERMNLENTVGISLPRTLPADRIVEFAQRAEQLGFAELWIVEDLFYRGGIAQAAVALASTSTIHVGVGILPAAARNAAFATLEAATLAEIYPGRLTLGIGHGMPDWMRQVGAWPASPLTLLQETLDTVRGLLRGETLNTQGRYVQLDDARLEFVPPVTPMVLAGVRGPKSLAISGAHADGTVLAEPVTPEYLSAVRSQIGATGDHRIVAYVNAVVSADAVTARSIARPSLAHMDARDVAVHIDPLPFADELRVLAASSTSPEDFARAMPDEWVDQLAVVGTADDVRRRLDVLHEAGAHGIVFIVTGDDAFAALESLATAL